MIFKGKNQGKKDLVNFGPRMPVTIGVPALPGKSPTIFKPFSALIDTGAGRSVIGLNVVSSLGLVQRNEEPLTRVGGTEIRPTYTVTLLFPKQQFKPVELIEVFGAPLPIHFDCILGRDVLTRWTLTYEGPTSSWSVEEQEFPEPVIPPHV